MNTAPASVKPDKQARSTEKVRTAISRLGAGQESKVEVRLRGRSKMAGYIHEINAHSSVVAQAKTGVPASVANSNVARVKGQKLSTGAKIAIGTAIGAGIALIILATYLKCCTG